MKKDLKYPSNSLYYSAPSKMIETHVTKEEKDNKIKKTRYRLLSRAKDQINRGAYKYKRGLTARRRSKSISDKLKEVHKPWHQRSTEDSVHDNGTILFDLT